MRRREHQRRVLFHLAGNLLHRVDEEVQFFFGLAFGGLDHERSRNDEREGDSVGVEAVIDEALGDIAGLDAAYLLALVAEDDLVHRGRLIWQLVMAFELLADVVRVEHSIFRGLAQAVGAVGEDVSQRADKHAEVAVKHANAADRVRPIVVQA